MTLNEIWFGLFVAIVAGYLILSGFDIGTGVLHLIVAKTDQERRSMLNSIGPVWDGNGVWLVLAGGVLFAVFPFVYASLFSGFYTAFMLVLLVIILRTVAIEFRSKRESPRWRSTWDVVFSLASTMLALLLGVAFGNIMRGVELNEQGDINMTLADLLNPYALLVGVTAAAMLTLHSSIFLSMKTEGDLHARLLTAIPRATVVFFVLATATVIATAVSDQQIKDRYLDDIWPVIFPAGALVAFVIAMRMLRQGRDFWAFVGSATMIALLLIAGAAGLYPNLLVSTINPTYNLTLNNAASEHNTLEVAFIIALIGIPLVLLYTAGVYYFFRGKTRLEPDSY